MPKKKKTESISLERETRVLLEEMHSDVKKTAEGHGILVAKLEEHGKRFDAIDKRFDMLEAAVSENGRSIKQNTVVIKQNSNGIKQIDEKLDKVLIDHEERIRKLELVK